MATLELDDHELDHLISWIGAEELAYLKYRTQGSGLSPSEVRRMQRVSILARKLVAARKGPFTPTVTIIVKAA
jgi:hypothetical protein